MRQFVAECTTCEASYGFDASEPKREEAIQRVRAVHAVDCSGDLGEFR